MKTMFFVLLIFIPFLNMAQSGEKYKITDLSFLSGYWKGDGFGGISEEYWGPATEDYLMGYYLHKKDDKINFTEFFNVLKINGEILLRLKHFNPDLTGWEEKDKFIDFKLIEINENKAVFDGLIYELVAPDSMLIHVTGTRDGEEWKEVFHMKRFKDH